MNKDILSWILYLGFIYEKNRLYDEYWRLKVRKRLQIQISLWKNTIELYMKPTQENSKRLYDNISINLKKLDNCYIDICNFIRPQIDMDNVNAADKRILQLELSLINELESLNRKVFPRNRDKMYMIIRSLHNLPRSLMTGQTFPNINVALSTVEATEYCIANLDNEFRQKYSQLLCNMVVS